MMSYAQVRTLAVLEHANDHGDAYAQQQSHYDPYQCAEDQAQAARGDRP